MTQPHGIRLGRADEVARILEIERDAATLFASLGLPEDLPGLEATEVRQACEEGRVRVVVAGEDRPIAFALCEAMPNALHLHELDVDPRHSRQGHGRRLIEHVRAEALDRNLDAVTLTTFVEVPWNAPYYEGLGFTEIEESETPPWLASLLRDERAGPLAPWSRVAMSIGAGEALSLGRAPL